MRWQASHKNRQCVSGLKPSCRPSWASVFAGAGLNHGASGGSTHWLEGGLLGTAVHLPQPRFKIKQRWFIIQIFSLWNQAVTQTDPKQQRIRFRKPPLASHLKLDPNAVSSLLSNMSVERERFCVQSVFTLKTITVIFTLRLFVRQRKQSATRLLLNHRRICSVSRADNRCWIPEL